MSRIKDKIIRRKIKIINGQYSYEYLSIRIFQFKSDEYLFRQCENSTNSEIFYTSPSFMIYSYFFGAIIHF